MNSHNQHFDNDTKSQARDRPPVSSPRLHHHPLPWQLIEQHPPRPVFTLRSTKLPFFSLLLSSAEKKKRFSSYPPPSACFFVYILYTQISLHNFPVSI
uniref:Uncharacterized protein n=1 Tax=Strigamia maritima TaxID=126957 RepID=T1J7R4_STRMM